MCKAFMHVPKEHRSKLDNKATPCVLVGYSDEEFGYGLWDLEKRKIVRSRDVVFHEHETIADIDNSRKTTDYPTGIADVTPISFSSGGATNEELC